MYSNSECLSLLFVANDMQPSGLGVASAVAFLCSSLPEGVSYKRLSILKPLNAPDIIHSPQNTIQRILREPSNFIHNCLSANTQIVHIHGIWNGAIRHIAELNQSGVTTVVSIHGMLDPTVLAVTPWKKAIVSAWHQRKMLRQAAAIHALNEREVEQVRSYLGSQCPPIVVIPNGVEIPMNPGPARPHKKRIFFCCCQFIPRKGLVELLDAWCNSGLSGDAELHIAGVGTGRYATDLVTRMQAEPGVRYLGFLTGEQRDNAYRDCDVVVLATKGEGMPMGILEGLAFGRPCITTPSANIPIIGTERLGWIADLGKPFGDALIAAYHLTPEEYADYAHRCRNYVQEHYSRATIAGLFCNLYERLLAAPNHPPTEVICYQA